MKRLTKLRNLGIKIIVIYLVLILIFIAATFLGARFSRQGQNAIVTKIEKNIEKIAYKVLRYGYLAIFLQNFINYICMCLPFIGIAHSVLVIFNTGFEFGTYLAQRYIFLSPETIAMSALTLLILPHAILELLSYSIAVESSISITLEILRGKHTLSRNDILIYMLKVCLGVLLLYLAAILEYSLIALSISKGNLSLNVPINYR